LQIKIRTSSSNIIDELGEDEDIRASLAAELVNSKRGILRKMEREKKRLVKITIVKAMKAK